MKFKDWLNENFDSVNHYVSDAEMLRQAIIEELDAINIYKAMAEKATNADVKKVLLHVAGEEKHHIGEFEFLLKRLDPEYQGNKLEGEEEAKEETT